MLRRRTPTAPAADLSTTTVDLSKAGGKGRPTPKRSESQKQRKQAVRPPANSKEARALARARMREERLARAEGLKRGDERSLPARDRGPVRRFARDYVDARYNVAEYFMLVIPVVLVLGLIRPIALLGTYLLFLTVVLGIADSVRLRLGLKRALAAKLPTAETKGITMYAVMRSLQFRALRLPKPQVRRGAKVA
ncbi:Protein of unknown function (DUF3043) [Motilibacter peucedani]|uniref:DUF3043 family protein n=1 Tax=Motilibacter peucedani TaxID=598650 RepID=A0A420XPD1_9ACTN|nr:DUF3043 domain-containing protein [Motilibacter peucedani]RKS74026.1 Protein of unknown function (DUF3043) [Motilibacter peucedani]